MNTKEKSAAELVGDIAASQIETIRLLLCPTKEDVTLGDSGTLLIDNGCAAELEVDDTGDYMDGDELDLDSMIDDRWDDLTEQARERWHEHGLAFDYHEGDEDHCGYWCYLISTGGPGTEIRFFANPNLSLYKAEFWYLPWFDGACVNVTRDETVRMMWDEFVETGTAAHVAREAD